MASCLRVALILGVVLAAAMAVQAAPNCKAACKAARKSFQPRGEFPQRRKHALSSVQLGFPCAARCVRGAASEFFNSIRETPKKTAFSAPLRAHHAAYGCRQHG